MPDGEWVHFVNFVGDESWQLSLPGNRRAFVSELAAGWSWMLNERKGPGLGWGTRLVEGLEDTAEGAKQRAAVEAGALWGSSRLEVLVENLDRSLVAARFSKKITETFGRPGLVITDVTEGELDEVQITLRLRSGWTWDSALVPGST